MELYDSMDIKQTVRISPMVSYPPQGTPTASMAISIKGFARGGDVSLVATLEEDQVKRLIAAAEMWLLAHPDAEDLAILDWVEKAKD